MPALRGRPDEELFLHGPCSTNNEILRVEPLRIYKVNSPDHYRSDRPGNPVSSMVSSSATLLPYPVDLKGENISESPWIQGHQPRHPPYPEDLIFPLKIPGSRNTPSPSASDRKPLTSGGNLITFNPLVHPQKKGPDLDRRRGSIPQSFSELPAQGIFCTKGHNLIPELYQSEGHPSPFLPELEAFCAESPNLSATTLTGVNQLSCSASMSTTRASRGSSPPTATPTISPCEPSGAGLQAHYAATRKSEGVSQENPQSQTEILAQRVYQKKSAKATLVPNSKSPVSGQEPSVTKRWTPTESSENKSHGANTIQRPNQAIQSLSPPRQGMRMQALEQELHQTQLSPSPPPAYSCLTLGASENTQVNPGIKRIRVPAAIYAASRPIAVASQSSSDLLHPAFGNTANKSNPNSAARATQVAPVNKLPNSPLAPKSGPNLPPPLPEGWISHLDQNSGQYYYIHLKTQATQWEFPKGPTPLNHDTTSPSTGPSTYENFLVSPSSSAFGKADLGSPRFHPHTPGYADILSMVSQSPTVAGFSGPPPSAGAEMYKIIPTNGVYFGPYLKYININIEKSIWLGSILLVSDSPRPPTIHIHRSVDLSPNPRQLKPNPIFTHQRWVFYRYDIDLEMTDKTSIKWTYAITSHLGCSRYEFVVAGRYETNWKLIAHSGNDFAMNTSVNERSKLGGIGFMWKDVLQKNTDCDGFHVQLGLGDQIYGDRLWKEIPLLKQWLTMSGKENRKNTPWTAQHEEDISHAYFHYYSSHFDQPYLREAFAQIPNILQINDHDIFDGFGSYPEHMQSSNLFQNIGRVAMKMYLLFQHHTTLDILQKSKSDMDLFTITGTGWHFVKYLGPAVVVIGADCRAERNERQVLSGDTYQGLFPKVATLPSSVQHCIWMIPVPVVYPRLDTMESLAQTFTTAKKGVTGTYNLLGKMTSSVAGVVGGKQAVASGFQQVKKVVGKSGLMGGILNTFGDIDIADELRGLWTHESKDLERTYLIRILQGIARQKGIRMTFLSGDVNCCGAGLLHDPSHPSDHKTMYQIISSAIVAAPPPSYVLKILHNTKILYVPANGEKSTHAISNTKEDMMEIFQAETDGWPRDTKKLMGRRNYVTLVAYDPEAIAGNPPATTSGTSDPRQAEPRLSLAVDFIVQGDSNSGKLIKYGPVIIPGLEYGR